MRTFQEQNNELAENFLSHTFDRGIENFNTIEFALSTKCNLACKYCYYNRYGEKLYPMELQDTDTCLKNLKLALDWLEGKGVRYKIDFFSGEPMVQESAFRALEMIAERDFVEKIVIPSNFTFILDESLTNRVEALLKRSRELNSPIILSASIDGKYCEGNRPFRGRKEDPRNDEYYDKVFEFCKKWGFSFHPMIYSEGIENWKRNFEWFQGMFRKFDIPFNSIYLLEIRNAEWTAPQVRTFAEFIRWLVNWTKGLLGERTVDFLFHRGFNILSNPLATVGRGLGCSIQSTLFIRLGDLSLMPCHRTSYPQFVYGNLETDGEKVTGLNIRNPELMVGIYSLDGNNLPFCESCLIKPLCQKGCLGSQYETTGDLFTPIPTVCLLEHGKMLGLVRGLIETGLFNEVLNRVKEEKRFALEQIVEMGGKKDGF